jgi:hypothetical protein
VSLDSCVHAILNSQHGLVREHGAFVVEEFIENGGSQKMTHRAFHSQQTNFPVLVLQQPSETSTTATP